MQYTTILCAAVKIFFAYFFLILMESRMLKCKSLENEDEKDAVEIPRPC